MIVFIPIYESSDVPKYSYSDPKPNSTYKSIKDRAKSVVGVRVNDYLYEENRLEAREAGLP